jgi:Uma2 family endonuclease
MTPMKYPIEQTDPPRSPRETLPTMYDLPSENPEEPGLPDEFHALQPELLRLTFQPPNSPPGEIFVGTDMNLYYNVRHPNWYKRPDWFAVVGVPRLYDGTDLRLSYVIWQEGISPLVVVELISPGTESEDLGQTTRQPNQPPTKWEVYERILKVPYYVVFDRYTNQLRVFILNGAGYQPVEFIEPKIWIPTLELGIGLWQGSYQGIDRLWLRWYDAGDNWIPIPQEKEAIAQHQAQIAQQQAQTAQQQAQTERQRAETEHQRAETERQRAEAAEARLQQMQQRMRELGIDPDTLGEG